METTMDSMEKPAPGEGLTDPGAQPAALPSGAGRWLLAFAMLFMLLPFQLIIGLPLLAVGLLSTAGPISTPGEMSRALDAFIETDLVIWLALVAAAIAGASAVLVALGWPAIMRLFGSGAPGSAAEWLAWRQPERIKLWMVPLMTLPAVVVVGYGVTALFGEPEIQIQLDLFRTPLMGAVATLVVSTIVPLAEELTFRGALYSALLGRGPATIREGIRPHIVPFVVTTILFAAVHLLSGFETVGAILQVLILSAFITTLRAVSGSVLPPLVAHIVWNFSAALLLMLGVANA